MAKRKFIFTILICLLLLSIILAVAIGSTSISFFDVLKVLKHKIFFWFPSSPELDQSLVDIVWLIRLPRVLLAVLVGISLALAGTTFQCLFRNPMADPYIIGVSAGAGLGATLAIVLHLRFWLYSLNLLPLMAFATAVLTTFLVYNLARRGNVVPMTTLLLAGIAVGSFLAAINSLLMLIGTEELYQAVLWLLGGLSGSDWLYVKIIVPYVIIGSFVIFIFARDLNVLLLGEEPAGYLGIEVEKLKKIMIITATLMTAAAVSVSGLIGFVGLIVPHIMRLVVGPDHRKLLPAAALSGAIIMLWADTLARSVLPAGELPVGLVTAILGAPFFLYLLRKTLRSL